MALAVVNDVCRMSSTASNIHPFFKHITEQPTSISRSATHHGISATLESEPSSKGKQEDESDYMVQEEPIQRNPSSANGESTPVPLDPNICKTVSQDSDCSNLNNLPPSNMASEFPEPQPKRRKVSKESDSARAMKQSTLWNKTATQCTSSEDTVEVTGPEDTKSSGNISSQDVKTLPPSHDDPSTAETATPPKKIMKLRTDGKLFSPKQKDKPVDAVQRGRKPGKSKRQRLIVLKYGTDRTSRHEIGERINKILKGELRIRQPPASSSAPQKPAASIKITSATPTKKMPHPFFLGKPKTELQIPIQPSLPRSVNVLSRSSSPHKRLTSASSQPAAGLLFGVGVAKINYPPDAVEPLWPPDGCVHIRGIIDDSTLENRKAQESLDITNKKSKGSIIPVKPDEDVLQHLTELAGNPQLVESVHKDAKYPSPTRHIVSRSEIPGLVSQRLTQHISNGKDGDIPDQDSRSTFSSVATQRLFDSLAAARSAFDKFTCENQEWINKYSPKSSLEVLQPQEPIQLLKNWLSGSAVHSTTNVSNSIKQKHKSVKKRRQVSELDDFIVASDDEVIDAADAQALSAPDTSHFHFHKTAPRPDKYGLLQRFTSETLSKTKAVIISGPSGCGKTAAVYAIAHELGVEIFEINPGNRRSGRDILEKVGDMTRNHLVNHGSAHPGDEEKSADEQTPTADNVQEEIASGKQSTMQSFFQTKTAKRPSKKESIKTPKSSQTKPPGVEAKKKPRTQKQSLILFEEVDILFEEDKQFWTTVAALIATSKRPMIMTCNDESLLPIEELEGCSVLRMRPALADMAIDYLLLIAAHEGHLLNRDAVSKLYAQNKSDLRASIMQLNMWCQMAINDPTGGLHWMLLPQDQHGASAEVSDPRVLSEDTFYSHLGMLGVNKSDLVSSSESNQNILSGAIHEWELSADDSVPGPLETISHLESEERTPYERVMDLDLAYDALSANDVQLSLSATSSLHRTVYAYPMTDQQRSNSFTINPSLLQVPSEETFVSDIGVFLDYSAISLMRRSADNQRTPFSHFDLCENAANRKAPLASHHRFIKETFNSALDLAMDCLEQTTSSMILDVAPYIRSIVSYDYRLQQERARLVSLLSDGSRQGKRQRTTRASRAALEGGHKSSTRRERWLEFDLDFPLVLETGGQHWQDNAWNEYERAIRRWKWAQKTEQSESEDELCQ